MKIIKRGEIPEGQGPWYLGKHGICPRCHTEVQIEAVSDVSDIKRSQKSGLMMARVYCPVCVSAMFIVQD